MRRKDSTFERWERLSGPPSREIFAARSRSVEEAEALLKRQVHLVDSDGDPMFLYCARLNFIRLYEYLWMLPDPPEDLDQRIRRAIEELEKVEPFGSFEPVSAARSIYRCLKDKDIALRFVRKGLELSIVEEEQMMEQDMPRYPGRELALRAELAILSDAAPECARIEEILDELVMREPVATGQDFDREVTAKKLFDAGIRTSSFRRWLEQDRAALVKAGPRIMKAPIAEIDGWLAHMSPE